MKHFITIIFCCITVVFGIKLPNLSQAPFTSVDGVRAAKMNVHDSVLYVAGEKGAVVTIILINHETLEQIEVIDSAKAGFKINSIYSIDYDSANVYFGSSNYLYVLTEGILSKVSIPCYITVLKAYSGGVVIGTNTCGVYKYGKDKVLSKISTDVKKVSGIEVVNNKVWIMKESVVEEKYFFGPIDSSWNTEDPIFKPFFYYEKMGMTMSKQPVFMGLQKGVLRIIGSKVVANYDSGIWKCHNAEDLEFHHYATLDSSKYTYSSLALGIIELNLDNMSKKLYSNVDNNLPSFGSRGAICTSPINGNTIYHFCGGSNGKISKFSNDVTAIVPQKYVSKTKKSFGGVYDVKGRLLTRSQDYKNKLPAGLYFLKIKSRFKKIIIK